MGLVAALTQAGFAERQIVTSDNAPAVAEHAASRIDAAAAIGWRSLTRMEAASA